MALETTLNSISHSRNLEVVIEDQMNFTCQSVRMAQFQRFGFHNIRQPDPFCYNMLYNTLRPGFNCVKARLLQWKVLQPVLSKQMQMIQNVSVREVFNEAKRAHITHLSIRLQWLPIVTQIKFITQMFANRTATGFAPLLHKPTTSDFRSLCSACEQHIMVQSKEAQHFLKTFTLTVPCGLNHLLNQSSVLCHF